MQGRRRWLRRLVSDFMNTLEETIVYDALALIEENSSALAALANTGTKADRDAYRAIYAAAIKLQAALGPDAIQRGKWRHKKTSEEARSFFANVKDEPRRHP